MASRKLILKTIWNHSLQGNVKKQSIFGTRLCKIKWVIYKCLPLPKALKEIYGFLLRIELFDIQQ